MMQPRATSAGAGSGANIRPAAAVICGALAMLLGVAVQATACVDHAFEVAASAPLEADPGALVFPDTPLGEGTTLTLTVRHQGTRGTVLLEPLEVDLDADVVEVIDVEVDGGDGALSPGEEARLRVRYRCETGARGEGVLRIGDSGAHPHLEVPVSVPGLRAALTVAPALVLFGVVPGGAPETRDVQVRNTGSAPAELAGVTLAGDSGDFSAYVQGERTVQPGGVGVVRVAYDPSGRDSDEALVTVHTDRDDVFVTFQVYGEEQTPVLSVEPASVQLGWVPVGGEKTVGAKLRNLGNQALTLTALTVTGQGSALDLPDAPAMPLALEPGRSVLVPVRYRPTSETPLTAAPLAQLTVTSDDPETPQRLVPIRGAAGEPDVTVSPPHQVDLGLVALGESGVRGVVVTNVGAVDVTLVAALLVDATTDALELEGVDGLPAALGPGESRALTVRFSNDVPDGAPVETASLRVLTDDPLVPEWPVAVVARRVYGPDCDPVLKPTVLALGGHRPGELADGVLTMVNEGSGPCVLTGHELAPCLELSPAPDLFFDCDPALTGSPFVVVDGPNPGAVLSPGEAAVFGVHFTAPPLSDPTAGRESHYARLVGRFLDPADGAEVISAAPPGGWANGVNLRAETAEPSVAARPAALDFGVSPLGCDSPRTRPLALDNLSPVGVMVTALELSGCPDSVSLHGLPTDGDGAPVDAFALGGFQTLDLELRYAPSAAVDVVCSVRVVCESETALVIDVPIAARAEEADGAQVDTFDGHTPRALDVLFVVDDSGSMHDEQSVLEGALPAIVAELVATGADVRLGVTTTDVTHVAGRLLGEPPWLGGDDAEAFSHRLVVAPTGSVWSHDERGLEAAWAALTGPNVAVTPYSCDGSPGSCPLYHRCRDAQCVGPNHGFLREQAELMIVVVSDEDDGSDGAPGAWAASFASLEKPWQGVGASLHAAVVPAEGCASVGSAPGHRYLAVADALGGVTADVCAADLVATFDAFGSAALGPPDRFFPSLWPEAGTLGVAVDGVACPDGSWVWNALVGAVIVDREGACMPGPGETLTVTYDAACPE